VQTDDELMADNVQTFINMGSLQKQYSKRTQHLAVKNKKLSLKRQ
jgi:hypothetical protein